MKIISGGQTGVDRAALDVAIERGLSWGGWCPSGGWAEDYPDPPGLLNKYPKLRETPLAAPEQRTEWNVRDSDAVLIIANREGLSVSPGTQSAVRWADNYGKPLAVVAINQADRSEYLATWLREQRERFGPQMTLSIGGPRESEAPGICAAAHLLLSTILERIGHDA